MSDIVGATNGATALQARGNFQICGISLRLAWLYAIGHSLALCLVTAAAANFAARIPAWLEPLIERTVGATLLVFGLWVMVQCSAALSARSQYRFQSRFMMLAQFVARLASLAKLQQPLSKPSPDFMSARTAHKTAFGIGVIHGFGAETGTQILIITMINGALNHALAIALLGTFLLGFALSNTSIALLLSLGYLSSSRIAPINTALGILSGLFSLCVGIQFLAGKANNLPAAPW
jgi:high-affinity nickel-transport protein